MGSGPITVNPGQETPWILWPYFANRGSTIDAVGNGHYLVCHLSSCFKVKGCEGP